MRVAGLVIVAISAALRFAALDRQGLWDDESFTLRRLGIIAEPMTQPEGAPPLYFLLLEGWTKLAGVSVAAVRAFSAVWGTAGVALAGLAARRMGSPAAGLFAAALVALHPFHLAYSQEARPYTMVFALASGTLWAGWEKRAWWYVAAATAGLWTHPWGVFVWISTAPLLGRWPAVLPLALAAPALWGFSQVEALGAFWARSPEWETLAQAVTALAGGPFYVGGWRFSTGWVHAVALAACVALWTGGMRREDNSRTRRRLGVALATMAALPIGAGLIAPIAVAHQRYWMAALPLAVAVAVRGWDELPAGWWPRAGFCWPPAGGARSITLRAGRRAMCGRLRRWSRTWPNRGRR